MLNFTPEQKNAQTVPYFEDVSKDDGWQGYSTTKSVKTLQAEIGDCIGRLGGIVSGFQKGTFHLEKQKRDGFQIHYSIQNPNGHLVSGRLDIAALPTKYGYDDKKRDKSLRMALYMLRVALNGMWFMQQLSPGYAALMPWMLADRDGKTVSQLWSESPTMKRLLPPGDMEFIEGEIKDE
jgi:hypothetical protein